MANYEEMYENLLMADVSCMQIDQFKGGSVNGNNIVVGSQLYFF